MPKPMPVSNLWSVTFMTSYEDNIRNTLAAAFTSNLTENK
jgi:hypothetical protein